MKRGISISMAALLAMASYAAQADAPVIPIMGLGSGAAEYRFKSVPYKPYVQTLRSPSGINILRDAPADHLHHHALMFAIAANGVDFWGEAKGQAGYQMGSVPEAAGTDALRQTLEWRAAPGKPALLRELRTVRVPAAGSGPTLLYWTSELTAPAEGGAVELKGSHYHGLGMRLLESMDGKGRFRYAGGAPGEIVRGEERLTPGAWCAYTGPAEGKAVTVAMYELPGNPRPALWFIMPVPFAYLSATLNTWKEPLTIAPGQTVTLRYAVAVWDGDASDETIGQVGASLAP